MTLTDKTVLITGGTGALGIGVVRAFLAAGATVHVSWIVDRETVRLREALGDDAEKIHLHQADVADPAAAERLVAAVEQASGSVDVLAHLVGGFTFAGLDETDPEVWDRMVRTNATSTFVCARAVAPSMRQRKWGRIIAVTAVPAVERGAANLTAYSASKAAVKNLVESLSRELVGDGVTVNAIAPTLIDTPANRAAMPDADRSTWLDPDDMGRVVAWLASEEAGIVTGTTVMLSRG